MSKHAWRYDPVARRLNEWGFAVRAYDQYGHGESMGPRGALPTDDRLLQDLAEVVDAMATVAARHRPLTAVLGPVTGRFKERILHVPVTGLDDLAADVIAATATMGDAPPEDRAFQGHLTLARVRPRQARLSPPALPPSVVGRPLAGSWTVRELTLVASDRRPGGSAYSVIDRAPLGSGDAPGDVPGGGSGDVPGDASGDGSG